MHVFLPSVGITVIKKSSPLFTIGNISTQTENESWLSEMIYQCKDNENIPKRRKSLTRKKFSKIILI